MNKEETLKEITRLQNKITELQFNLENRLREGDVCVLKDTTDRRIIVSDYWTGELLAVDENCQVVGSRRTCDSLDDVYQIVGRGQKLIF